MCQTDDKGILHADVLLLLRLIIIGERQQQSCQQQAAAHNDQSRTENGLYFVLEKYPHNADRYHGYQYIDDVTCLLVHLPLEQSLENPVNLFPEYHQRTEHRSHMYHYRKSKILLSLNTEQCRTDGEVSATAHRQIFGQSLNKPKDKRFKPFQFV